MEILCVRVSVCIYGLIKGIIAYFVSLEEVILADEDNDTDDRMPFDGI